MDQNQAIEFLHIMELLKCRTRHCETSSGRTESVAEHCHRLAVFAWMLQGEFPEMDMNRVIRMSLFHDIGEAVTGDIPSFRKTEQDEETEAEAIGEILDRLPEDRREELQELFREMEEQKTAESQLWKALDKMEAVIQHNESDIKTWLPLEYELQRSHGTAEAGVFTYTKELRKLVLAQTEEKIRTEGRDK